MILTSYIPALDMLTIQLDPLSKPVGPVFNEQLAMNNCQYSITLFGRSPSVAFGLRGVGLSAISFY